MNSLLLRGCGVDGGLEEMVDELSGGKCLYAFMQVTDPNTQLPKNVLVNWVGPPSLSLTIVSLLGSEMLCSLLSNQTRVGTVHTHKTHTTPKHFIVDSLSLLLPLPPSLSSLLLLSLLIPSKERVSHPQGKECVLDIHMMLQTTLE